MVNEPLQPVTPEALVDPLFPLREEIANSVTHGVGLGLSIAACYTLVTYSLTQGSTWQLIGCGVYGCTLVVLYLVSTLYHGMRNPRAKQILRIADHACIYLLIAGTYTPFTLIILRGAWGWTLFGIVWTLAAAGIIFKLVCGHRFEAWSVTFYILMGWSALIAAKPILESVPVGAILWLLAGGVAYTLGVLFYARDRLPYYHAVWHVFVLLGSICHFWAVVSYVLPVTA